MTATVPESPVTAAARIALAVFALLLGGCEKTFENMYDQPRYKPLAASPLWSDGRASRPPVEGTVARSRGETAGTSSGRAGLVQAESDAATAATLAGAASRRALTPALLARGQTRYDIFCAPCHGAAGDGEGMVVRRGFPRPPSLHIGRLRAASDDDIFAVITRGYGAMYAHADRITPDDRRAVIAYVRALQLAQNARLGDVPPEARSTLEPGR